MWSTFPIPFSLIRKPKYSSGIIVGIIRNMSGINLMSLTDDQKKDFINSFDTVITDCDGVLWHTNNPIPGAKEVMNYMSLIKKRRYYFTNNSTKTRQDLVKKFTDLGFASTEDEILSTSWLAARYLKNLNFNKKVYVIGTPAIEEELKNVGIQSFGSGPDHFNGSPTLDNKDKIDIDPEVGAVVIGYDFYFSFPKLVKACSYLNNPDCLFVATNTDERFPASSSLIIPGAGAFVAALQTCSERKADVMGKPSRLAISTILEPSGVNPKRCLMIGDRCNTDIQFGNVSGMTTLLVETGVHNHTHVEEYKSSNMNHLVPSYYTSSIADLLKIMQL